MKSVHLRTSSHGRRRRGGRSLMRWVCERVVTTIVAVCGAGE